MSRSVLAIALSFTFATAAFADVLELTDGRVVEGVVQMRKADALVLSRFGTTSIPRDQIKKHLKGPSVDAQIKKHLAALGPTDMDGRLRLATWLQELGRVSEAHALAGQVIENDPEHAGAHKLLGHERYRGRWMTPDDAKRAQGLERHGDRWYTPAEWKLADPVRRAAARAEEAAARERQINQLLELLVSPDPALRSRARTSLRKLAAARGISKQRVDDALQAAAAYVLRLDDAMVRAGGSGSGRKGWMLAEMHDDFTRLKTPIREFATSLASTTSPVTILLPEVRLVRIRTTVAVPVIGLTPSR